MDKTIFSNIFNNIILNRIIFNNVHELNCRFNKKSFKWCEVLKLPCLLASRNYLDQLKIYLNDDSNPISTKNNDIFPEGKIVDEAIRGGSLEMFEYLINYFHIDHNLKYKSETIILAYSYSPFSGNLELMKFLSAKADESTFEEEYFGATKRNVFDAATAVGNIGLIEWLFANRTQDIQGSDMLKTALKFRNNTNMVEYLLTEHKHTFNFEENKFIPSHYVSRENHEFFEMLVRNGCIISDEIMDHAIDENNLDLVKWLHYNTTYQCCWQTIDKTAKAGNLDLLKWLNENRTEVASTDAMDYASANGHLHVVKWLHYNRSEGCTTRAMDFCCMEKDYFGNEDYNNDKTPLEIIKFLHETRSEGCTEDALNSAAIEGNLEVVKFLYNNRTERYSDDVFDEIALNGQHQILEWFDQQEDTDMIFSEDILLHIVQSGYLNVLKFLYSKNGEENRFGFTTEIMDLAIMYEHLDIMIWLYENLPEITKNPSLSKTYYCNMEVFQWLVEHYGQNKIIKSINLSYFLKFIDNQKDMKFLLNMLSTDYLNQLITIQKEMESEYIAFIILDTLKKHIKIMKKMKINNKISI
ncbi:hypothetical protein PPL_02752 [Heterostelium album PN500]|uniref:Ankyrin repeat protein n=1 Tax=Heterostelium pallidum (strain ATCC 26659 / Pp 5 / PN500) TaxID=670386 RepID=D3B2Y7_HETP5|nr:hypothetical protein PPL_02752 [Heterostelium album PN500]EFA83685.1 hypothetical protein PPL_02752 [Heterostelium album PN500]|eukprot:XP_020435802.1 hypothetical protein PPL_02752 [Heterostelium album PN500]